MTTVFVLMVCGEICLNLDNSHHIYWPPIAVRDYKTREACEAEAKRLVYEVAKPGEAFTAWCIGRP